MSFEIIDLNMPTDKQVVATSPYVDVAELMALGYTRVRYGTEGSLYGVRHGFRDIRSVEVRDDDGRLVTEYGIEDRPTITRLGGNGRV